MPDLTTRYCGLRLCNPLVLASGAIGETVDRIRRASDAGVGAVVMKSCFEHVVSRTAPTPRFRILDHGRPSRRSFTFYSYEQASVWGPDRYAREIEKVKREIDIPLFASINCETEEGWESYARTMERAGADAVEMNVSCPHGSISFTNERVLDRTVRAAEIVTSTVKVPVALKMSPQTTTPVADAKRIEAAGVSAVVAFNRFTGLDIDVSTERPILHGGYAGHGGPWALAYVLRWISEMSGQLRVDIAASGGVTTAYDVVKCLLAGAASVQTCTAVYLGGYDVIGSLVTGLEAWMKEKGYRAVDDFRGKVTGDAIVDTDDVHRTHDKVALIDTETCVSCGECRKVCLYGAVREDAGSWTVLECCDGCGLCVEVCPVDAIRMTPKGSA